MSAEFNHMQEFDADNLAIKFLESNKEDSLAVIKDALKNNNTTSRTHPSRRKRLERAKEVIEIIRSRQDQAFITVDSPTKLIN